MRLVVPLILLVVTLLGSEVGRTQLSAELSQANSTEQLLQASTPAGKGSIQSIAFSFSAQFLRRAIDWFTGKVFDGFYFKGKWQNEKFIFNNSYTPSALNTPLHIVIRVLLI